MEHDVQITLTIEGDTREDAEKLGHTLAWKAYESDDRVVAMKVLLETVGAARDVWMRGHDLEAPGRPGRG